MAAKQSSNDKSTTIQPENKPRQWTPAQRKKFRKTMKLKRANIDHKANGKSIAAKKKSHEDRTTLDKEIIVTLMEAEKLALKAYKEDKIERFSRDQLLSMLALNSVLGS